MYYWSVFEYKHVNREICHRYDEELFLKNHVHVDLHYQINRVAK